MTTGKFIQLHFTGIENDQAQMLVALLADIGFSGFEEAECDLKAIIHADALNEPALEEVLKLVPANPDRSVMESQNWNEQWESSFDPIRVHDFVAIRANFHAPVADVKYEIVITPKMSFGTGHHATTYMMIAGMEGMNLAGKRVLDFGTGTGVLAILAQKMGAAQVDAIDYDEWSIENAGENVAANNCGNITLVKADSIVAGNVYDVILANINLNVIRQNMNALRAVSNTGSLVLLSGFVKSDEQIMKAALGAVGFGVNNSMQRGEWICMSALLK